MIEVSILIPVADNSGVKFNRTVHTAFQAFLIAEFGGFTRMPGAASGGWIAGGILYRDKHRIYIVDLPSITDGGKVGPVVDAVKRMYGQLNVYIRYLGLAEIL